MAEQTITKTDIELLDEIITRAETQIEYDWIGDDATVARLAMYNALRRRAQGIMDTIGSSEVAQAVVRENMPMLAPAIDLARAEGWL